MSPGRGDVSGTSIQEETPEKTEDMLDRLYLSAGPGTSQCPSGGVGGRVHGDEHLDDDLNQDKHQRTNE